MAGILPYTRVNPFTGKQGIDDIWVMISKERWGADAGTWDMFSGQVDPGESKAEAAAREGAEESCEMFGTAKKIAEKMFPLNNSSSTFLLKAEDLKTVGEITKECSNEAYLKRKTSTKYQKPSFQEKTRVKWVKLASLIDACVNYKGVLKNGGKELKIRPYFSKMIAKHGQYLQGRLIDTQKDAIKKAK